MSAKKPAAGKPTAHGSNEHTAEASGAVTSAHSTVSSPAKSEKGTAAADAASEKMAGAQELAASMPFNRTKPGEYGDASAVPAPGATAKPEDPRVTGSSLTESIFLALGAGAVLVDMAGVPVALRSGEPDFIVAIGVRRHHDRELDPPAV